MEVCEKGRDFFYLFVESNQKGLNKNTSHKIKREFMLGENSRNDEIHTYRGSVNLFLFSK